MAKSNVTQEIASKVGVTHMESMVSSESFNRSNYAGGQRANFVSRSRTTGMLLLSTFLLLFFTSCRDDENVVNNKEAIMPAFNNSQEFCPSNPDNPYDIWGFLHNEALDYFYEHRTYAGNYFAEYKAEALSLIVDYYSIANPDNITGSIANKRDYYYALEVSNYNTRYEKKFSSSLAKTLSDKLITNFRLSLEGELSPNAIEPTINTIRNWEANLLKTINQNPNAMSVDDIKKLWIQSSNLRYSFFYWSNDMANPNGILNSELQFEFVFEDCPDDEPIMSLFSKGLWDSIVKAGVVAIFDLGGPWSSAAATILIAANEYDSRCGTCCCCTGTCK